MIQGLPVGRQLKYLRNLKNLNQSELAKGICSVSYLSKVEKGTLQPSSKIKDSLFIKLGYSQSEEDYQLNESNLRECYYYILHKKIPDADKLYLSLKSKELTGLSKYSFDIISIFYFMEKKQFVYAAKIVEKVTDYEPHLTNELRYYLYKVASARCNPACRNREFP
jgi:HTH-type transcriptional regulator, quorum sensing regulator NprR